MLGYRINEDVCVEGGVFRVKFTHIYILLFEILISKPSNFLGLTVVTTITEYAISSELCNFSNGVINSSAEEKLRFCV